VERCYQVSRELLKFLNDQDRLDRERDVSLTWERIHSIGSARIASLLAARRGVDVELSHAAGALHDFGRFVTGKQANHAENGYGPAKEFLRKVGLFSEKEIEAIGQAVKNHSRKEAIGTPLEEIAKDADVLDCAYLGLPPKKEAHLKRFISLQEELGLRR
jgi:uncharacterized protein